ncbi:GNAT family N-acetyltransferase [Virgibacillus doumboii]|uniref:GNAT family N-acetyltransferase n=1 Tax=Virgibacillus doumboii TaxID=2697503 RepID=UPI0013DF71BF|nr:GNAT family N-acetyltransferase [Virgibacillus doumboii]
MTVTFTPMSEERFNQYLEVKLEDYANEHVKAGNWNEENALENARNQFDLLLPDGLETENQRLFTVMDGDESVGILWIHVKSHENDKQAFIYDIELDENQRGKGFGTATMTHLEEYAKEEGISQIGLHVFAHNKPALALYEKMGYESISYNMAKKV